MISRRTIFALLLALLVPLGIRAWAEQHRDACDLPGPHGVMPVSVFVDTGTRTVVVPCSEWLMRQPSWVQFLWVLEWVLGVVFLLSAWDDWRRWQQRRQPS